MQSTTFRKARFTHIEVISASKTAQQYNLNSSYRLIYFLLLLFFRSEQI